MYLALSFSPLGDNPIAFMFGLSRVAENYKKPKILSKVLTQIHYPAMYSGVIASGSDNKIKYKDIDMHYDSNKIILINKNGLKFFEGNSFLSLYTMLDKENNK